MVYSSKVELDSFIDVTTPSPKNEDGQIRDLRKFFSKLDGSVHAFENMYPVLFKVFHPNFKMILNNEKEIPFVEFLNYLVKFTCNSGVAKLEHAEKKVQNGTVTIVVNNILPGESSDITEQTLTYSDDGKIIQCEAVTFNTFHSLIGRVSTLPKDDDDKDAVVAKFRNFISIIDGSTGIYERAEPLIDDFCDPQLFVTRTPQGLQDQSWLRNFVEKVSEGKNIATIKEVGITDSGLFHTEIHNTVKGQDVGSSEQVGVVRNGKIIYWEAVEADEDKYNYMVTRSLMSSAEAETIAEKFRTFIHTFDGSIDAYEKAQPLMDEIFDPALIIYTDQGERDYKWYQNFAMAFSKGRNVAIVKEMEMKEAGCFRTFVKNTVQGQEMDICEVQGVVKNGKIISWKAIEGDEKHFNDFINSVLCPFAIE